MDVLKVSNFDDIDTVPNSAAAVTSSADSSAQQYFDKYDDVVYGVPYGIIDKNAIGSDQDAAAAAANQFRGFSRFDQYTDDGGNMVVDQQMDESAAAKYFADANILPCDISAAECPENEECVQLEPKTRQGICNCAHNYVRNEHGKCLKLPDGLLLTPADRGGDADGIIGDGRTTAAAQRQLTVSVVSKTVRLPEQEVTLSAYTIPDEKSSGDTYKYLWQLISQPSGDVNGTMSDQTKDNIKLSKLSEGLYRFKVMVTGTNAYGDAYANVTVSPEKRINRAPIVRITPEQQTVRLPTSKAILDGSASTVDDKVVSWHWDLIQGPIGYQPVLAEVSTLQLADLTAPGNYTFKLTLIDSNNMTNSTTASISVLKANDYPPEANAGADQMVYLPRNSITLNGNQSKDDHEIVAWEWTKVSSSADSKAVDMQNTRTPYLQLSNLEQGTYTFMLRVSDASNQTSTAEVHVFVKPPTNLPPHADAGQNVTINLPQTWTQLNASQSTDDINITSFKWRLVGGPNVPVIVGDNRTVANATGLTIGTYLFAVDVSDENGNNASDTVTVTVIQGKNEQKSERE